MVTDYEAAHNRVVRDKDEFNAKLNEVLATNTSLEEEMVRLKERLNTLDGQN